MSPRYYGLLILSALVVFTGCSKRTNLPRSDAAYVEQSVDVLQENTLQSFSSGEFAKLEDQADAARSNLTRLSNGGWVLESYVEAFVPKQARMKHDRVVDTFSEWASQFPTSQFRAACEAHYWRNAARQGSDRELRSAQWKLRTAALESIKEPITCPQFAVERLMRLTSRDSDREKAAKIYVEATAAQSGYAPLIEAYAGWLSGFASAEVGPWLAHEADLIGGVKGDEIYAQVAVSRARSNSDWVAARKLDWSRIQGGLWSIHRRWPGADGMMDKLAQAALTRKDLRVLQWSMRAMDKPQKTAWSNNLGFYLRARRMAGLEAPSGLTPVVEFTPDRDQRLSAAAYSPDGKLLAIGGAKGELSLWSVDEQKLLWSDQNPHWVSSLAFSSDGRWLAVSGGNYHDSKKGGNVRVWDLRNRTVFASLDDLPEQMNAVRFSPGGDVLWSGGGGKAGQVARWQAGAAKIELVPASSFPYGAVQSIAVGESQVYLSSWKRLWTLRNDSADGSAKVLFKGEFSYSSLALSPDGRRLAAGTWKNTDQWDAPASVEVFAVDNMASPLSVLTVRGTRAIHLAFTPDGHRLLAATNASDVQVWDAAEYRPIVNFYADGWMIDGFGISPDSRQTVTIDTSAVVRLWNLPRN